MNYEKFITGPLQVNTYVAVHPDGGCIVIDPSNGCGEVLSYLRSESLRPCAVLLTHGHFDHIMGIPEILNEYKDTPVYIHPDDQASLSDPVMNGSVLIGENFTFTESVKLLSEGVMSTGQFEFTVFHVPGHTAGGCVFLFENVCFCGDVIFAGSVGRTDLPGGSFQRLIAGIREKIITLPADTVLCPGHGGRTTVDREKRHNPFLQENRT